MAEVTEKSFKELFQNCLMQIWNDFCFLLSSIRAVLPNLALQYVEEYEQLKQDFKFDLFPPNFATSLDSFQMISNLYGKSTVFFSRFCCIIDKMHKSLSDNFACFLKFYKISFCCHSI